MLHFSPLWIKSTEWDNGIILSRGDHLRIRSCSHFSQHSLINGWDFSTWSKWYVSIVSISVQLITYVSSNQKLAQILHFRVSYLGYPNYFWHILGARKNINSFIHRVRVWLIQLFLQALSLLWVAASKFLPKLLSWTKQHDTNDFFLKLNLRKGKNYWKLKLKEKINK